MTFSMKYFSQQSPWVVEGTFCFKVEYNKNNIPEIAIIFTLYWNVKRKMLVQTSSANVIYLRVFYQIKNSILNKN